MKRRYRRLTILAGLLAATIWGYGRPPEPGILAFRLGQTFEQVVKDSIYPVLERSIRPADSPSDHKFGATYVEEPAVISRFTDPKHGFTLPPTKFLGDDIYGWKSGEPMRWRQPENAVTGSSVQ